VADWGWIAGGYGVLLALTAIALPGVAKRAVVVATSAAYALIGLGLETVGGFWVNLVAPGALLLGGYWLSGFFFRSPQAWLERWLIRTDEQFFAAVGVNRLLQRAPKWLLEMLEASYTADYIVVGAGAIVSAPLGVDAVSRYWTLVLAAELACYAALPFLRSRPPRALEAPGVIERRRPAMRRFNVAILDRASVQANTIPSGHVAGAVAAALAVMPISAEAGWLFLVMSLLIAASAVAGRYHYAVDCVLGALVAVVVSALA
jgi:membrane-associated phospholipid phosphatase